MNNKVEKENKTGWISYYISSKGSRSGPRYLYLPWSGIEDIKEHILYRHEEWALWAEWYKIEVEVSVQPPLDEINKELKETLEIIKSKNALVGLLFDQRTKWYGEQTELLNPKPAEE